MRFALLTALLFASFATTALTLYPETVEGATFARQSLFLSKTPVTEGETVLIHTVVANESNVKFTGDVVLREGDAKIGSIAVAIAPGGANAVSLSWKPAHGSHKIVAELTAEDGTVVESESETFLIDEKPKPGSNESTGSTGVDSSKNIQDKITEVLPAATVVSQPVFTTLDSARANAAKALDSGINWAKEKTGNKKPGEVLSASTQAGSGNIMDTIWLVLATILLYIFSVLRFMVGNAGIFYPAFALLFFYILWRIYKRMRRPNYAA